jgi:hypothetical protein
MIRVRQSQTAHFPANDVGMGSGWHPESYLKLMGISEGTTDTLKVGEQGASGGLNGIAKQEHIQHYFRKTAIANAVIPALPTDPSPSHTSNPLDQIMGLLETL